jgi:hypothetical protein
MHRNNDNPLSLLPNELMEKIWVEELKKPDRLAMASTCLDYLCFFKSRATSTSIKDLQYQLSRTSTIKIIPSDFVNVDKSVIDRLTSEFAEEFRLGEDKINFLEWMIYEPIENPVAWKLAFVRAVFDLELNTTPEGLFSFNLTVSDLPYGVEFIKGLYSFHKTGDSTPIFNQLKIIIEQAPNPDLVSLFTNICVSLKNKLSQDMPPRPDTDFIKLPVFLVTSIMHHIFDRKLTSDRMANFLSSALSQCSSEQIDNLNSNILFNLNHDSDTHQYGYNSNLLIKIARFLRILPSLEMLTKDIDTPMKNWIHRHYFKHGHQLTALRQQLLIQSIMPLLLELQLKYSDLDRNLFFAAYIYCLDTRSFSRLNHDLKQFINEMALLKYTHHQVYSYLTKELSYSFQVGVEISSRGNIYIEILTPYLSRKIVQPVLDRCVNTLDKLTQYGYHFPTSQTNLTRFINCLIGYINSLIGYDKIRDSKMLTETDLDYIFQLMEIYKSNLDVVIRLVEYKNNGIPKMTHITPS